MRLLPLVLCLLPLAAHADQTFTLTRDGEPAATVVIARNAPQTVHFAVAELLEHVHRISGARLPVTTEDAPVTGPRILVGESRETRHMGLRSRRMASQEYAITFRPGVLAIVGRDADVRGKGGPALPEVAPGRFASGRAFDGKRNVVTVPSLKLNDEVGSYECWVNMIPERPSHHGTFLRMDGGGPWSYHILQRDMNSDRITYMTYDGTNVRSVTTPRDVAPGWHHVLCTWDLAANRVELFLDGVSQGSNEYRKTTCQGVALGIGGCLPDASGAVGNAYAGLLDEVRVSDVVRDPRTDAAGGPYQPDAHTLCLFHFDEEKDAPRDVMGTLGGLEPPPLFGENGTLYGVYDFLERYCSVRWYLPGDLGTDLTIRPTLKVAARDLRRSPSMIHRWITPTPLLVPGPGSPVSDRDATLWKLRMRIGGQPFWVCHSFYGYYDRFLKDHPDWFAQGYQGQPPQMCYTNPEFIAQVVADARDYFDGKGAQPGAAAMGDVFGLVPQDNCAWCKCPRCQAELNRAQDGNPQFNNGRASDYIFGFVNKVAREVRKTHPDKWIGALAYSDYAYYPDRVGCAPNVVVQTCLHTRNWWCPSMEANDRKVIDQWRGADPARPLYLWLYYNFPALNAQYENFHYFPGYNAHQVVEQMQLYHDKGFQGIFMEHSSEFGQSTLMDQLEFYVTLKLADDPALNGEALINEFFRRYYRNAAAPMQQLYERMEDIFTNPRYYPESIRKSPGHQHQTAELASRYLGTAEHLRALQPLMDRAVAAARTPLEKARVDLFKRGQWDYVVEGRRLLDEREARMKADLRRVSVPRIAPEAAGDPARVDWSPVAEAGPWSALSGEPTDRRLTTRLAHDGRFLYVELTEATPVASLGSTSAVYDGDDFEVFAAAKRDDAYHQLCISPAGKSTEQAWKAASTEWHSGARIVSDLSDPGCWRLLIALPLDRLIPGGAKPGGLLYANFYRASPGASHLLAWTPTFGAGFHDTRRLPELTLAP